MTDLFSKSLTAINMKKKLYITATAGIMTLTIGMTAFAGQWKQDTTGWWWQEDNGSYPVNKWEEVNGKWYYFDSTGYMLHDTVTPDGYQVGSDGAWIAGNAVKNSGVIASVIDVKTVGAAGANFRTNGAGDMYIAEDYERGKYIYYNKNFEQQFSVPMEINGYSVKYPSCFLDGMALVATYSEYGYGIDYMFAYDGAGNRICDLGTISDMFRFAPGQDPNGMTMFTWTKHTDGLRFVSYSSTAGFSEKIYYYKDYPELEKVNNLVGFENGRANLLCTTVDHIENEGYINQRTYYNHEIIMSVDTLGNIGGSEVSVKKEQNTLDYYVNTNYTEKLGDAGARFEKEGAEIVLRDATGAEKFRTDGSEWFSNVTGYVNIVNENYFLAKPKGAHYDSPMHLYQVVYQ